MGRSPCSDDASLKKGPWTVEEDEKLREFIRENGHGSWRALPKLAGLNRCGKSCRLRWTNYLRPDIKRGKFSEEEEHRIIELHSVRGNKWSEIARQLPGRTDNEIKNYWNTHLRKRLLQKGIDPTTHRPRADLAFLASIPSLIAAANLGSDPIDSALRLHDATQLAKLQLLNNLVQVLTSTPAAPLLAPSLQSTDLGRLFHGQTLPPIGHQLPSHTSVVSPDVIHIPAGSTDSRDGYGSPELLGGFTPHASDAGGDPIVYNHAYDTYSNQLGFSTPDQSRQDLSFVMNSDSTSYDMWGESSYDDFNLMEQYLP